MFKATLFLGAFALFCTALPRGTHAQIAAPPGFVAESPTGDPDLGGPPGYLYGAEVVVADFDRKFQMDLLLTGLPAPVQANRALNQPQAGVYRDKRRDLLDPPMTLHEYGMIKPNPITGVFLSHASTTDFNSDGWPDVLVTGATTGGPPYTAATRLYDGARNMARVDAPFVDVHSGSSDWADYDGDGDPDLLLTGISADGFVTRLYRNDGGAFTDVPVSLPPVGYGHAAWGDYDGDGDPDVVLLGVMHPERFVTRIYRNDDGAFVDAGVPMRQLAFGRAAWFDYDNDGRLDLLISGGFLNPFLLEGATVLYHNEGNGQFSESRIEDRGLFGGKIVTGDLDNDGDPDAMITGQQRAGGARFAWIFHNDGSALRFHYGIPLLIDPGFDLGDYDGDDDLDIFITGFSTEGGGLVQPSSQFYVNQQAANTPPSAPQNLESDIGEGTIRLSWTAAADDRTPAPGLTYNIRIGTFPGGDDVVSALADAATGQRWVSAPGNAGRRLTYRLDGLPVGTYYWSVQALDASFAGSIFAPERQIGLGDPNDVEPPAPPQGLATATSAAARIVLSWYPNTEPDLQSYRIYRRREAAPYALVTSITSGQLFYIDEAVEIGRRYFYRITAVDRSGNESGFSAEVSAVPGPPFADANVSMPGVSNGEVAWGDYDRDGDLDFLVVGAGVSRIYRNTGGAFTNAEAPFQSVNNAAADWGDYDGDGDLDVVLAGSAIARIYRQDAAGFAALQAGLPGVNNAAVGWADYDGDGDLDLALAGNATSSRVGTLYRNDRGVFVDAAAGLTATGQAFLSWADYDGDGDPDLLLAGDFSAGVHTTLYQNQGGVLVDAQVGFPGLVSASGDWGDYDNDGDLDLVIAGNASGTNIVRIYRNDDGAFVDVDAGLPGLLRGAAAWGDVDNDGDLDLLLTGVGTTWIFRNENGAFERPLENVLATFPGATDAAVALGDYDNDGDLDVLIVGREGTRNASRLFRNNLANLNAPPSPPSGLTATVAGSAVTLAWMPAEDDHTPTPGLSYNLRVGTAPGAGDVLPPMSLPDGTRLLARPGNAWLNTAWPLRGLASGTYYWSVQAVDGAFKGSPFAAEGTFVVGGQQSTPVEAGGALPSSVVLEAPYPNPFADQVVVRYGVPAASSVQVEVYDVLGRRVRVLRKGMQAAGMADVVWDGRSEGGARVVPGVYFVRLTTQEGAVRTVRVVSR